MTTFTEFCVNKVKAQREDNYNFLIKQIETRDQTLSEKINNCYKSLTDFQKTQISIDDIWERTKTDPIYQSRFAINPGRQGLDEKLQIDWLKDTGKHPEIQKLSASGEKAITFNDGVKITGKKGKRSKSGTKSLDAQVDDTTFCIMKRTGDDGGAQDNQCEDVVKFIKEIRKYLEKTNAQEKYLFYLDGPYYTTARRFELQDMIPDTLKDRMIITSCESVSKPQ
jgi:hypothetical protein